MHFNYHTRNRNNIFSIETTETDIKELWYSLIILTFMLLFSILFQLYSMHCNWKTFQEMDK